MNATSLITETEALNLVIRRNGNSEVLLQPDCEEFLTKRVKKRFGNKKE